MMVKADQGKGKPMTLNRIVLAMLASFVLIPPALAQLVTIDKSYEAQKESEIATARLQLATQPGSAAAQELGEADALMRRLKAAKPATPSAGSGSPTCGRCSG
jgi:hypothetical protein